MRVAIVRREPKVALSMDVYADNLIAGLKEVHPDWEIIEVAPEPWSDDLENLWHSGNPLKKYYERFYNHPRTVKQIDADIFHIIDHTNAHVAYGLKKLGKPVVVTCHDLVQYVYPEILKNQSRFPALSMAMWQYSVKGIAAADGAIAISSNTAKDITKWLKIDPQKVSVVLNGVNPRFRVLDPQVVANWRQDYLESAEEICLLNVGSNHQRKNVETVLKVVKAIADLNIPVRLWKIGEAFTDEQQQFIENNNLAQHITFLGSPSQEDLIRFYNAADILLAPSLYEGFGLTVLEAMGCGTPVITANVSSLPEVAGEAAILVNPLDVDAMVQAVRQIRDDAVYRQDLIDQGLARVQKFSWQKTAAQTASFYQQVIASKHQVLSNYANNNMKVLLSAYSCEPGKGSERGVGWNLAKAIAKHHQVWVFTRPDESKEAIEAELARNPVPNLHFVYFTLPFWQDSLRWGQSGAMQLHYYLWQIQAYFVAKKMHREINFDIAHHVTFVRYSVPSLLSLLPIPFIWGPVGGGESAPPTFWTDFNTKNKLYEWLRGAWRSIGELDPLTHLTARKSTIAYATTKDTAKKLAKLGALNIKQASETGISQAEIEQLIQCPSPSGQQVRFINVARLLHWKGIYLGLRAFAAANLTDAQYWVVGAGPEREKLEAMAQELEIADRVTFFGLIDREEVLYRLGQSTALVHPSLHDSGGWVPLEAMASGRPILCLDLGGPGETVTPDIGIKVPAHNPEQAVRDLAAAMVKLAANPDLCIQMGQKGQQRIREFYSWEAKAQRLSDVYQQCVAEFALNRD